MRTRCVSNRREEFSKKQEPPTREFCHFLSTRSNPVLHHGHTRKLMRWGCEAVKVVTVGGSNGWGGGIAYAPALRCSDMIPFIAIFMLLHSLSSPCNLCSRAIIIPRNMLTSSLALCLSRSVWLGSITSLVVKSNRISMSQHKKMNESDKNGSL